MNAARDDETKTRRRRTTGAGEELPAIQHCYDLAAWLLPQIQRFPRAYRYTLGARIEAQVLDLLDDLIEARYASRGEPTRKRLERASARLVKLRYVLRLAVELRYLPLKKEQYTAERLDELGRMVGGWLKAQRRAS